MLPRIQWIVTHRQEEYEKTASHETNFQNKISGFEFATQGSLKWQ